MTSTASTPGPIVCKAAVAFEANKPLKICNVTVAPPKAGEVRVKIISNALCHTDVYTWSGMDREAVWPAILGHEATGIVESIGAGVTTVKPSDIVIPCYTPACLEDDCIFCASPKTNLCPKIRAMQGKGLMPDGTTRFSLDGEPIYHFMGCSSFSEYTVISEISCAKINPHADLDAVSVLGCGVATGWGAVINTAKIQPKTTIGVFGLGAVGLSVVQAAKEAGAAHIIGFDVNDLKFSIAKKFGATECFNSSVGDAATKEWVYSKFKWGLDYTFDCTGNVKVMRTALELAHRGWGESIIIGVAAAGHEIATRPFNLVIGKQWKGTAFGGWKSRLDVPKLVNKVVLGETDISGFITHKFNGIEKVNDAFDALHSGKCLRGVVKINPHPQNSTTTPPNLCVVSSSRVSGGVLKRVSHFSNVLQCKMHFSIFLPSNSIPDQRTLYPVLYYLSGLTCTDENATQKGNYSTTAGKHQIAMVFPDTSPRGVGPADAGDNWDFGYGAGYYVDATVPKYKNWQMYSYINKELPELINQHFPVDPARKSIMGHSMGGLGALISHFKNPENSFRSVSCLSPIANASESPWSKKAFQLYLGSVEAGKQYDPTLLVKNFAGKKLPILIDMGTNDEFEFGLLVQDFVDAAKASGYPVTLRMQEGYDHSYHYVSTFLADHIEHHAKYL